jgi:hypothetical protein
VCRVALRKAGIASGVEGLAILLAVNVLAHFGRSDYAAPVIAIIVGLHFMPLAQRLPAPCATPRQHC